MTHLFLKFDFINEFLQSLIIWEKNIMRNKIKNGEIFKKKCNWEIKLKIVKYLIKKCKWEIKIKIMKYLKKL